MLEIIDELLINEVVNVIESNNDNIESFNKFNNNNVVQIFNDHNGINNNNNDLITNNNEEINKENDFDNLQKTKVIKELQKLHVYKILRKLQDIIQDISDIRQVNLQPIQDDIAKVYFCFSI